MDHDEIMTVEEVAKYLKLKPQTVYKWAQEGQIPGTKLGKEWRFRKRLLDEWIDTSITLSKTSNIAVCVVIVKSSRPPCRSFKTRRTLSTTRVSTPACA